MHVPHIGPPAYKTAPPVDHSLAVQSQPSITRFLCSGKKQLISGACPMCKLQLNEWAEMKEHVKKCLRTHQHPLLMRTCYCPYCLKRLGDAYSLSSHIQRCHSSTLHDLKTEVLNYGQKTAEVLGFPANKMSEPFPFVCSSCDNGWPTAIGIAEHFVNQERIPSRSCGGRLIVNISQHAVASNESRNRYTINRYDFASPTRCPYCPKVFEEVYEMSRHIQALHKAAQQEPECKQEPSASMLLKYAPFCCTSCCCSFKKMEEWAEHYQENVMNGRPCYGDVYIANNVNESAPKTGPSTSKTNIPAANGVGREIKEEPMDTEEPPADPSTSQPLPVAATAANGNAVVKEEPIDDWSAPGPSNGHPAAAASGTAIVKEEPLHDWFTPGAGTGTTNGQARVKEEPMDEPSCSYSTPPVKRRRVDENPAVSARFVKNTSTVGQLFRCPICTEMFSAHAEFSLHLVHCGKVDEKLASDPQPCEFCKKSKFASAEAKRKHEQMCGQIHLSESRDRLFNRQLFCPLCSKTQANAYVLGNHMMLEHEHTIHKLRKHHQMASEFLPFRCSTCKVGFEDPRILLNHFRLRDELGIPCTGNLAVNNYEGSLQDLEKQEVKRKGVKIPKLSSENEVDEPSSPEWCPRDPVPSSSFADNEKTQCPECTEIWPRSQIKLHVKMEHPQYFYNNAPFKCRVCKKYAFFCVWRYAEHFEACFSSLISCISATQHGEADERALVCAASSMSFNYSKAMQKPSTQLFRLPGIPEELGNDIQSCRYCNQSFAPLGLLQHLKKEHTAEHFANAPYQCEKCGEVGFYRFSDFKAHNKCTGTTPLSQENNAYAITMQEVKRAGVERSDIPSFRSLIDPERRRHGTFTAFNRPLKCPHCNMWCSSMLTLAEHYADGHKKVADPFLCGGCGQIFPEIMQLRKHLFNQNLLGTTQCFDMAVVYDERASLGKKPSFNPSMDVHIPPAPTVSIGASMRMQPPGASLQPFNWRSEVGLDKPGRSGFMNLARQQYFQKKNGMALPITPLTQASKSPLAGERFSVLPKVSQLSLPQRQQLLVTDRPFGSGTQPQSSQFVTRPSIMTSSKQPGPVNSQQSCILPRPIQRIVVPKYSLATPPSQFGRNTLIRVPPGPSGTTGTIRVLPGTTGAARAPSTPGSTYLIKSSGTSAPKREPKEEPNA